jgi:hypothetical protein
MSTCQTHMKQLELTQIHMVPLAIIECLIIKCLFLIAVMVALSYSIGYRSYHIPVAAVLHPREESNLDNLDV